MDDFRRTLVAAYSATGVGATAEMAAVMRDTVLGRMFAFKSAIEGVKISMMLLNRGPLVDILEKMTEWIRVNEELIATKVSAFITEIFEGLVWLVKNRALVLEYAVLVLKLVVGLKALAVVLGVVNFLMAANPITLVVLAVVALIAAVAALVIWWEDIIKAFRDSGAAVDYFILAAAALTGPIGWLIGAGLLLVKHWEPIRDFFIALWADIVAAFDRAIEYIGGAIDRAFEEVQAVFDTVAGFTSEIAGNVADTVSGVGSDVAGFFGFGDEEEEGAARGSEAQVVSPSERISRQIEERYTADKSEVTIRDETGRAEVTRGTLGAGLVLEPSGAF
jgi:hypothetical protein